MIQTLPTTRSASLDLPIALAVGGSQPVRVHAALRDAILGGRLAAGTRLPSSRMLAAQLGVRRNAVVVAFEQLGSEGLVDGRHGAGTFVAALLPRRSTSAEPAAFPISVARYGAFALGRTCADPVLLKAFARLIRRDLLVGGPEPFGYGDPRGSAALRRAVAGHLATARGVVCDPDRIVITGGTQQAIRFCTDALLRPGDAVWLEDPGYPAARQCFAAAGARLVPVPVDAAGLDVAAGRRIEPNAALAYVTPSHQFPTGVVMTMERRLALLDWAQAVGAYVLEDDYDSEFRYAGPPLMALAGIDGQRRVIYLGTFSKTLFPGLRVGYAVLPPELVTSVVAARVAADRFPSTLGSAALAGLIETGGFAAHLRRMRTRYRAARDLVATTLVRASAGLLRVPIPDQGLHLTAYLPPDWAAGSAAMIRAAAGIEARIFSETRLVAATQDGLILGYSGHTLPDLRGAAERLGWAVLEHARLRSSA